MKILNPKCNAFRKSRASLTGSIIIFMMAFLVFCICAIDVGYTVTSRYKTQKITETIALYMASYLNSLPETKKTKETLFFSFLKQKLLLKYYTVKDIFLYSATLTA